MNDQQQHRPPHRYRQTCAFDYLTIAPKNGHLDARDAAREAPRAQSQLGQGMSVRGHSQPAVPVTRRVHRRAVEVVE
jgi:hypothetical protein